jgi:hypothetical protein
MKAGDTVVCIGSDNKQLKSGNKYTIYKVIADYYLFLYEFKPGNGLNIWFFKKDFVSLSVDRRNKLLKLKEKIDGCR